VSHSRLLLATLSLALALGCAPKRVALSPEAARVRVSRDEPPAGFVPLGPLEASDRSYSAALAALQSAAAREHADFVKLTSVTEPHAEGDCCFDDHFLLKGLAFRRPDAATH
jgi:hypothetical protein